MAKKKVENVQEMEQTEIKAEETVEIPALTLEDFKEKVTVKERIGFLDKQALIQSVYDGCVKKDSINGIYYIDRIMQMVSYRVAVLGMYTNYYDVIKFNYAYDYLDELGVFDYIIEIVAKDIVDVLCAVEDFELRVANLNSTGSCVYRLLNETLTKLPEMKDINKLISNLPKAINKVDKDVWAVFAKELKNGTIANQVIGQKK